MPWRQVVRDALGFLLATPGGGGAGWLLTQARPSTDARPGGGPPADRSGAGSSTGRTSGAGAGAGTHGS